MYDSDTHSASILARSRTAGAVARAKFAVTGVLITNIVGGKAFGGRPRMTATVDRLLQTTFLATFLLYGSRASYDGKAH